jgi:alanine-glyoxylate transaminase/serine-glyoxylate transaminase/serine-pyruvate transaminase
MPVVDRILMGPGPSNPYPEATEALGRPLLGHLDPEFLEILDETCDRLRTVWGTDNAVTLPISGTGSAGMEAAFVNLVGPGDVVVIGVNGLFGQRMCDVAERCGGQVVAVEAPWGQPLDPAAVLGAHPAPKLIGLVHAETSTGVCNDVAAVAAGKGDALVLADCVTSLGGIPVAVDDWGVDVAYSGTQKCLGVAPGLAPLTLGSRAWERRVERPRSWYLDLGMIGGYTAGAIRKYHHTAPVAMIASLHAALGALLAEGLEASWSRHRRCGQDLQDGLVKLGLELCVAEEHRLPELTTVWVPEGVDDVEVRRSLLETYGIEIGPGAGPWAGQVWRIGVMGHGARDRNVTLLLAGLTEILAR